MPVTKKETVEQLMGVEMHMADPGEYTPYHKRSTCHRRGDKEVSVHRDYRTISHYEGRVFVYRIYYIDFAYPTNNSQVIKFLYIF